MTLFDFSKAYDRVWRTGLLQKMHLLGIPARFLVWISSWLMNRQAKIRVNAKVGRSRTFKEGLPQGSVLSPLLFVIYINDLLTHFEETTLKSAYANDLEDARLKLNLNKCEDTFFQPKHKDSSILQSELYPSPST